VLTATSERPTIKQPTLRTAAGTGNAPTTPGSMEFTHDLSLPATSPDELRALAEDVELTDTERRRILAMARLLDKNDPHLLLGVSGAADPKTLKRAYFLLSKEVHPDRYYGKRLGTFAERLTTVFEATSRAYNRITSGNKRATGNEAAIDSDQPQTPQEYAAELFDRACQLEVGGDALGAMKLFAAAVRVDPQTRYLRRATSCALQAGQPRTAVEYAKKAQLQAPNDVSSARLLAAAFRAAGKLSDAEEVLLMAMALKSENDVLTAELRNDLAEVRRQIAASS
jgi:tetratricopeptide (TPR) repeat protein